MESQIEIINPGQWKEYRDMRLRALKTDPIAFGASYEQGVKKSRKDWKIELADSNRKTYVVRVNGIPVALAAVRFEKAGNVEHLATIYSVFTDPEFRNLGVGSKLLQKILDDLHTNTKTVKVRLSVNLNQVDAKRMYERAGFFQEGILKKEMKVGDTYYDQAQMALIFEDKL